MIKIKDSVDKVILRNHGFKNYGHNAMVKEIGTLSIYVNFDTRKVTGLGFYPVGDRIVLNNIKGLILKGLIEQEEPNEDR